MTTHHITIPDEQAMLAWGAQLAKACPMKTILFLYGELGAGKTTLARGFLRGLGYMDKVKSPTYTLVEPYELMQGYLYHFDFYRIQQADELEYMGLQDYFRPDAICLIEWPEQAKGFLPPPDLSCHITIQNNHRDVALMSNTEVGKKIIERITHEN